MAHPPSVGVNAVDQDAQTPLHYAAFHGRTDTVTLLLQYGAHQSVVNLLGLTPLHIAASLGHSEIVDQLGAEQPPAQAVGTPMHGAAQYGRVGLFAKPQLLPYLSTADETGTTPLHLAASSVDAASVRALVSLGADVHRRNEDGDAPLHMAMAWLECRVREVENARAADRKDNARRLRGAAAGDLVRRGPTALALPGVPEPVCRKLDDFRAVVLSFLAAGVRVDRVGGGGGARAPPARVADVLAHPPERRRLWAAAARAAGHHGARAAAGGRRAAGRAPLGWTPCPPGGRRVGGRVPRHPRRVTIVPRRRRPVAPPHPRGPPVTVRQ